MKKHSTVYAGHGSFNLCVFVDVYACMYGCGDLSESQITPGVLSYHSMLYSFETVPLNESIWIRGSQLSSPKDPPVSVPYSTVTTGVCDALVFTEVLGFE